MNANQRRALTFLAVLAATIVACVWLELDVAHSRLVGFGRGLLQWIIVGCALGVVLAAVLRSERAD